MQIDHVVALADAWVKGAAGWAAGEADLVRERHPEPAGRVLVRERRQGRRRRGHLAAPVKAYRCAYVARQVAVKPKYQVAVTGAERAAMVAVLGTCPTMTPPMAKVIALGGAPAYRPPVTPASDPAPIAKPVPRPPAPKPVHQPAPQPPTRSRGSPPGRVLLTARAPSGTPSRAP